MAKRVGITTDPKRRREEHEKEYPNLYDWELVKSGLTKKQAQEIENEYIEKRGYKGNPGGRDPGSGGSYYVYTFRY